MRATSIIPILTLALTANAHNSGFSGGFSGRVSSNGFGSNDGGSGWPALPTPTPFPVWGGPPAYFPPAPPPLPPQSLNQPFTSPPWPLQWPGNPSMHPPFGPPMASTIKPQATTHTPSSSTPAALQTSEALTPAPDYPMAAAGVTKSQSISDNSVGTVAIKSLSSVGNSDKSNISRFWGILVVMSGFIVMFWPLYP